jgi:hypothetical protein
VELCTGIVEERGLDIIGIYRVPGNTAAVTSLTDAVNRGFETINLQVNYPLFILLIKNRKVNVT